MRPLHVLYVDDNPADLALASDVFEHLDPDVVLSTSGSGRDALNVLRDPHTRRPDVLLLDINMPGLSGFDVLEALKEDPTLADIPVVMLSTSSTRHDIQRAYTLHATSFVVKHAEFPGFVAQVDALLAYLHVNPLPERSEGG